ncbi:hypothetical protein Dimus_027079, partial [Dionaea muscipula]
RRFIVVANAEWPMNRVPHTSVMRLDPSLFTGLLMFKGDFLESLVLFHDRASIPEFQSVVNLESLEDHRIDVRHHPCWGFPWLNYLYGEKDNQWRLRVALLSEGEELSDAESCSGP